MGGVPRPGLGLRARPDAAGALTAEEHVTADLASHEDDWDGLGVYIGLAFALPALVPCALAGLALRVRRVRRPLAVGLGMLLVAPVLWVADMPLLLVPMLVGVGLVVVAVLPDGPAR